MLTTKQRMFAYTYSKTRDLASAAKQAEISEVEAGEWLVQPAIQAVILADQIADINTATETRERVISRYAEIANADILDYFVPETQCTILRPLEDLTPAQRRCIKSIKHNAQGVPALELYDRLRATDKIAEIIGILDKNDTGESSEEKAARIRHLLKEMEDVTTGVTTH